MRALATGLTVLLLSAAPGCKGESEAEAVTKQLIADTNGLAEAVEKGEGPEAIRAAAERLKATMERAKPFAVLTPEDEVRTRKYEGQLDDSYRRLEKALAADPEAAKVVAAAYGKGKGKP